MEHIALVALGIAALTAGSEALIRGALAAARRLEISPLLAGLVLVGFGTSAPELVVSVHAALGERPDLALGNVVGSNIGNVLLILGLCALIRPLAVHPSALRRDGVTMVAASALFLVLVGGRSLVRWDAAILVSALVAYLAFAYWSETYRGDPAAEMHRAEAEEMTALPRSVASVLVALAGGLLLLVVGSRLVVGGAVEIAAELGVSEAVIGLTLVAVGTSLPELSVSVLAAVRRHADVAVGNILGSNIFNVLGIAGVTALLQPLPVHPRILAFDQWVLLGSACLLLVFLSTGLRLSRTEGGVLVLGYALYLALGFSWYAT